jgi:hypothetical protein
LGLKGFMVLNEGGSTIFSKFVDLKFNADPEIFGPLLEAIQIFSRNLDPNRNYGIEELVVFGEKLLYRQFENLTFIGIIDPKISSKMGDIILEYMICAFLSYFRPILEESKDIFISSDFKEFDDLFLKYRNAKEKNLKKWIQKMPTSKIQYVLNKMTNYFPISEIVKLNPNRLKIIGKKLLWVNINIDSKEKSEILTKLKSKTSSIYGPTLFNTIEKEMKEKFLSDVI